jgi:hypothetical protein
MYNKQNSIMKLFLLLVLINATGCLSNNQKSLEDIDNSLAKAARYLISKQSPDGAWLSETYGCFKDGPSLTPYVMSCLFFLKNSDINVESSFEKGVDYLVNMVDEDGNIRTEPVGLSFPVYTAASASRVVVLQDKSERNLKAQSAWLKYLLARRLNKSLGWQPSDPEYGGWGFSLDLPHKPPQGQLPDPFSSSNLTATIFGIGALRSTKIDPNNPIWKDILIFVYKCQNFSDDPVKSDARFDDGGFFFCPGDPVQNKAGVAGIDNSANQRFYSYGSMTADGLRALLACGLPAEHPRVKAAQKWLEYNFDVKNNPGTFNKDREIIRNATYYYYLWSVAHAFSRLGITQIETKNGSLDWANALADELIRRQRKDGSWHNRFSDAKEDDPLVDAPWAAAALAVCRQVIADNQNPSAPDFIRR